MSTMAAINTPTSTSDQSTLIDKSTFDTILAKLNDTDSGDSIKPDYQCARQQLLFASLALVGSMYFLSYNSYVIYPCALLFTCFSLCLFHLIAMDCVHGLFTPSQTLNRVIGELVLLPFIQPYETHCATVSVTNIDTHTSPLSTQDRLKKIVDRHVYDDSQPIYRTLLSKFSHSQSLSLMTLAIYGVQATVIVATLYQSPLSVIRYWLLPILLYPFLYPSVMLVFSNDINALLPADMSATIPSYHLGRVATRITEYQSGKLNAKARAENTPQQRVSRGIINDIRDGIVEVWPRLHWVNIVFVVVVPILAFIGARYVTLTTPTLIWSLIYYVFSGLGITAGYHRLFAHRAYEAHPSVMALMILMGTAALEGSVKWWCGGHRIHHRYTDTDYDPYSAKTGFWYAHIGWMMVHPKPELKIKADLKDLNDHAMIRWQHKNYLWFGPFCAFVIPTVVAGLGWGDWLGGLIYAGMIRLFVVHHATFCVNSVAHFLGDHTFDDSRTPKDHLITAFLTFGEGYHNFHHEFPNDYRNGIRFFDYDPTKWLIKGFNLIGLTYKLRVFPSNEIEKGKIHMKEKQIARAKSNIVYPPPVDTLPLMTWSEMKEQIKAGKQLTVIDDLIHDISSFIGRHPGGKAFIESSIGCDATVRFRGDTGIYKHSQAAHHLLSSYRIARLSESVEERSERKTKEEERLKKFQPKL